MTTVRELIDALAKLDQDRVVILQKDSEGNGYSPLGGFDSARYLPDSTYSGEVFSEEDGGDLAVRCVVLFPIN